MSQAEIDQTLQSLSAQVEKYKADVKAAARVLTGYTIDNKTFTASFDPNLQENLNRDGKTL